MIARRQIDRVEIEKTNYPAVAIPPIVWQWDIVGLGDR
jgi:hypothetical protein